jgi:hypothetical protein
VREREVGERRRRGMRVEVGWRWSDREGEGERENINKKFINK